MGVRVATHDDILKLNEDFELTFYFTADYSDHVADGAIKEAKDDSGELLALTCTVIPMASIPAATLARLRAQNDKWSEENAPVITGIKIALDAGDITYPDFDKTQVYYDVYSAAPGGTRKRRMQGKLTCDRNVNE